MPENPAVRSRALQVGRLFGVPVLLQPSWFLLAGVIVLSYGPALARGGGSGQGYLAAGSFAVLLLLSVLLHEAGHCLAARALGLRVRSITVSFLAGLTEIVDAPPTPAKAGAVSLAGPAVSGLLAVGAAVGARAVDASTTGYAVLSLIAITNGGLAVFNLLPGLPLDGGGVLRAGVWKLTGDRFQATVVAAQIGRLLGVLVVPLLVLGGTRLLGGRLSVIGTVTGLLVALFVYSGATAALGRARVERRLSGVTAGQLARPALLVAAQLPLAEALRRAHDAALHAMVVVDETGRVQAVVSEAAVQAVPEHRRAWIGVGELARPLEDGLVLSPELAGDDLLDAVRRTPASEYVVSPPHGARVLVTQDLDRAAAGRALPTVA